MTNGWEFADLARTLICLAAYSTFLTLRDPERFDRIKTVGVLSQLSGYIGKAVGKAGTRQLYSPRAQVKTTLITLHIPKSLTDIIGRYAAMTGISRNQAYSDFLQKGLLIYLKAENTLMNNRAEDDSMDS